MGAGCASDLAFPSLCIPRSRLRAKERSSSALSANGAPSRAEYTLHGRITLWEPLARRRGIGSRAVGAVTRPDGGRTVTLQASSSIVNAVVTVRQNGRLIFRSAALELRPDQPLAIDLAAAAGPLMIEAPGIAVTLP